MSNRGTYGGIKKPINTTKSSDRRLAGGRRPDNYLHNAIVGPSAAVGTKSSKPSYGGTSSGTSSNRSVSSEKTVKRQGGGKSWEDSSLLEWDPKHFRLFVGNLGEDANDELLATAFGRFPTMRKAKVPVDNRSGKNKGYGFVAFESAEDYFQAFKEMNGKYIGQHPVHLKRAETQIKSTKKRSR